MSNFNTSYGFLGISEILKNKRAAVHFSGVGGVGMYSLAVMSQELGFLVSGTDRTENDYTMELRRAGVDIVIGSFSERVRCADILVYSLAVPRASPEIKMADELGIPTVSRADYLSYLTGCYEMGIAVAGSHGKSTITSMLADILVGDSRDPAVFSGAATSSGSPYRSGRGKVALYEACEYRDSFLCLSPTFCAVSSVELDHTDYFQSESAIRRSFLALINKTRELAVLSSDCAGVLEILPEVRTPYVTYGAAQSASYRYSVDEFCDTGSRFSVYHGTSRSHFTLNAVGLHNVHNATCAIALANEVGVSYNIIKDALYDFRLPKRRLEYIGSFLGRSVYYDYAHHPTEIAAAIRAVKVWYSGEVTVVFAPHTYSRTASLWDGFVRQLSQADSVILLDIFAAREAQIPEINSKRLAAAIGCGAVRADSFEVPELLRSTRGAIVLMGAGSMDGVLEALKRSNIFIGKE